jgi:hypothetical protein
VDILLRVIGVAMLILYLGLGLKTARIGRELGRDETVWGVYAFTVPVISYVHARLLMRRRSSLPPTSD